MDIFDLMRNVFALTAGVGAVLAALTGLAFGLFKLFGDKWLTAKFDERLENYKHAQQRELEKLRFTINALMDRTTKLNQHEFEVLPQVWALLSEAYSEAAHFTSPLQSYPDLNRMTPAHLIEFLEKSPLENWQKAELSTQSDKPAHPRKKINIGENFSIQIAAAAKVRPTYFLLGGFTDDESGGWLLEEMEKNLNLCIAEKKKKIAKVRAKYPEWWLIFPDQIAYGLDDFDKQLFRDQVSITHDFDRVVLLDPNNPSRSFDVVSKT